MEEELVGLFRSTLHSAAFVGGKAVADFEKAFADFCNVNYCVGVGSGTDALRLALIAAGIGAGESVLTVPNSFIATTEAVSQSGALPEFIDIDEATYNIDVEKLHWYLHTQCRRDTASGRPVSNRTSRTIAAVVPVHLYGQMANMDPIFELAEYWNLTVIEDACQAHGAEYFSRTEERWQKAGTLGRAAAFSFYPGKNLGACGEAGAVTTNDSELAQKIRMLRDHGQSEKYFHDFEGYNGRLDSIQAGILTHKLAHLKEWNELRRANAEIYKELLSGNDVVIIPEEPSWSRAVYHLYVVRVQNRKEVQDYLKSAGVGTGIHYPIPLHLQSAYRKLGYRAGDFPIAEKVASQILSLPMYPQLGRDEQEKVCSAIRDCVTSIGSLASR
jgi:dTDP-4-amino-4,6-dideoxygalactose transaminase